MDKYENKVKIDEIKYLIDQGQYSEAVVIADTIDWTKCKSAIVLGNVSDLYKLSRRYEESKSLLLFAYNRNQTNRSIVYALCEISILTDDIEAAKQYYLEFVAIAPKDTKKYILKYKLFEANGASFEKRIEVLEEYKKRDCREKWIYELAFLYHRMGLSTQCVEQCDELVIWFGEGKYVIKALELKMLHSALSSEQQKIYDNRFGDTENGEEVDYSQNEIEAKKEESSHESSLEGVIIETEVEKDIVEEYEINVQTVDVNNEYNTMNIQKALAENMSQYLINHEEEEVISSEDNIEEMIDEIKPNEIEPNNIETEESSPEEMIEVIEDEVVEEVAQNLVEDVTQKIVDKEDILTSDTIVMDREMKTIIEDIIRSHREADPVLETEAIVNEVFFGETAEIDITGSLIMEQLRNEQLKKQMKEDVKLDQEKIEINESTTFTQTIIEENIKKISINVHEHLEENKKFEQFVQMESDGQIKLIVPEAEHIDKQITGQMNISDVLLEWEQLKQENERVREESLRLSLLEETGKMFTEFEEATRDNILEKLEKGEILPELEKKLEELIDQEKESIIMEEQVGQEDLSSQVQQGSSIEDEIEEDLSIEEKDEITITDDLVIEESNLQDEEDIEEFEVEEVLSSVEENLSIGEEIEIKEDLSVSGEVIKEDIAIIGDISEKEEGESNDVISRPLTRDEKVYFSSYILTKESKRQLAYVLDNVTMVSKSGNLIVTGLKGTDTIAMIKRLIKTVQGKDEHFTGKVAKVAAQELNKREFSTMINKLDNGALIILNASKLEETTTIKLKEALDREDLQIIIVLEDTTRSIDRYLNKNLELKDYFGSRFDIKAIDDKLLTEYGCKYAKELEYDIDEMGVLALHTKITDKQTSDHTVNLDEVKIIIDEAIISANKKTTGHFFDILVGKRYNNEDMIILKEKDFI